MCIVDKYVLNNTYIVRVSYMYCIYTKCVSYMYYIYAKCAYMLNDDELA